MKEIVVPQNYIDDCNKKDDIVFFNQLSEVFQRYGEKINSINHSTQVICNSTDNELKESIFNLLDKVDIEKKPFLYDLLIDSKFSKKRLAKQLIKDVYKICEADSLDNNMEITAWFFCEDLRKLKQLYFFDDYVNILNIYKLGTCRQPIVSLLALSKKEQLFDILLEHINDVQINGHILTILKKRKHPELTNISKMFLNDDRAWVRAIAQQYGCET